MTIRPIVRYPDPRLALPAQRVRWALEEAALPYRVKSLPFGDRNAEHFAHQRATARPCIVKAHADQMAHFAAADA